MEYKTPQVAVLGDASELIQGSKSGNPDNASLTDLIQEDFETLD